MPSYVTLQQARRQLSTDTSGLIATANDEIIAPYLYAASQAISDYCGRVFSPIYAQYGFDGNTGWTNPILMLQDNDLVSVIELQNGNGDVIASDSYVLLPTGRWPKETVRLAQGTYFLPPSAVVSSNWQVCPPFALPNVAYAIDAIQINGIWCYHKNWPRAWQATTLTLTSSLDTTDTEITLTGTVGTQLDVGSVIQIVSSTADEGYETMLVTGDIASSTPDGWVGSTLQVVRDYDNFTDVSRAFAHDSGATVYVFQPETTIVHCTAQTVAAFYKQRDNATGDQQLVQGFGSASMVISQDIPARVKRLLHPYWSHWHGRTE